MRAFWILCVGSPGMGRPAERGQLGIKKAYCLGIGVLTALEFK
jgi:hypothetical protein